MIDKVEAIAIARDRAASNGWSWGEPVRCEHRRGWLGDGARWEIETNAGMRGTKARFRIDAVTGQVLDQGYIPR